MAWNKLGRSEKNAGGVEYEAHATFRDKNNFIEKNKVKMHTSSKGGRKVFNGKFYQSYGEQVYILDLNTGEQKTISAPIKLSSGDMSALQIINEKLIMIQWEYGSNPSARVRIYEINKDNTFTELWKGNTPVWGINKMALLNNALWFRSGSSVKSSFDKFDLTTLQLTVVIPNITGDDVDKLGVIYMWDERKILIVNGQKYGETIFIDDSGKVTKKQWVFANHTIMYGGKASAGKYERVNKIDGNKIVQITYSNTKCDEMAFMVDGTLFNENMIPTEIRYEPYPLVTGGYVGRPSVPEDIEQYLITYTYRDKTTAIYRPIKQSENPEYLTYYLSKKAIMY